MKCKAALQRLIGSFDIIVILVIFILALAFACTPFEREIAEEVIHEAVVAEQAIEADLEKNEPAHG